MDKHGVGVAFANRPDSFNAGQDVAKSALANGGVKQPSLALAFCSARTNSLEFFQGIRSVIGDAPPIIGGAAAGIITATFLDYSQYPCGAAIFDRTVLEAKTAFARGVDQDPRQTGVELSQQLVADRSSKAVLLFYESIQVPLCGQSPPVIVPSCALLEGFSRHQGQFPPIFGAGLLGDYSFQQSQQFCGSSVERLAASATLLMGEFEVHSTITHGCSLLDGIYRVITKLDGPVLYELDGNSAVGTINELYGGTEWQAEHPVGMLTIGLNQGHRYAPFDEQNYVNRLISGVLPDRSGVLFFETGPCLGNEIQFLHRDPAKMVESARQNAQMLLDTVQLAGARPFFALYVDCAGRTAMSSRTRTEEAAEIQALMVANGIPLLGMYSGVELAPIRGETRGLDWTGVLMLFTKQS
ncbi:MAG TPA: FIST N-terminal domain-containing protein [Polyangiaceae bacterium]